MSAYVRQIIQQKRERHYQPSAEALVCGFKGWYSRGYLPHFDAPAVRQLITYRSADAMPASRRHEWRALLSFENEREKRMAIEAYLDRGFGECHLRQPQIAELVQENLLHFDGKSYRLLAWVIMPNHVHVLIEMLETPLAQVLKSWKSYTSKQANALLRRAGRFWEPEYFDRYIRDMEHFRIARRYIENNPVKGRLVREPQAWPWGSAAYRSADSLSARTDDLQSTSRGQAVRAPIT